MTKMVGFHIDMNTQRFRGEYLKGWLKYLSECGYNAIIWEVENNIEWESCPECVSPDAFSKDEFKELLAYSRELGLEPVPLFQVIGHCEYVLKHDAYKHLAEIDGQISQYCPRNPEVMSFLKEWIAEYLEVFGDVERFHLGADEAWTLGSCERCRAYAEKYSMSDLYIDHINAVSAPLIERGIQPVIWADMVLHYPEALDKLSRKIMLFDWMYNVYHGCGKVMVWGKGYKTKDNLDADTIERFGQYLFPFSGETGRDPEPFYCADYLADKGFATVTCPGSSSYGDNVFSPRTYLHLRNTFDSFHKGREKHFKGSVLTSWTVHLFPWELQTACIEAPKFIIENPDASLADYEQYFVEKNFGISDRGFFKACELLSKSCLFTHTASLGFEKSGFPTPGDHVEKELGRIAKTKRLEAELDNCRQRLSEYEQALELFERYSNEAVKGDELFGYWKLAACNLVNRAQVSICILENEMGLKVKNAGGILKEMNQLKKETYGLYDKISSPTRRDEIITWQFGAYEKAMEQIIAKNVEGDQRL